MLISAAAAVCAASVMRNICGRVCTAELICGESYGVEESAGIVVIRSSVALLVGNAVICCVYKKLRRTLHSYYREDTEGNKKSGACGVYDKLLADRVTYSLGDIRIFCAAAGTSAVTIAYLRS